EGRGTWRCVCGRACRRRVQAHVGAEDRGCGLLSRCVATGLLELVRGRKPRRVHRRLQVAPERIRARAIDRDRRHPDQDREHDRDQDDRLPGLTGAPHQYSVLKTAAALSTMWLAVAWATIGVISTRLKRIVT